MRCANRATGGASKREPGVTWMRFWRGGASGELVVGATNEDAGFDLSTTPAGLGQLLNEAQAISSQVGNYPILEIWTGLRPATPDGFPVLGQSALPGVYYATGHYRNGILL